MIYTVTCNPSLDYVVTVPGFQMNKTNRTTSESMVAGGKGINVSLVLRNLGFESKVLGFQAGFVGQEILRQLDLAGCVTDFVTVAQGNSRINVKVKNYEGTEINGSGPKVSEGELGQLMAKLAGLQPGDVLVLAGSIPVSLPADLYLQMMNRLAEKEVQVVLDASGNTLRSGVAGRPFLVKPNRNELGELFDVTVQEKEEVLLHAKKLQDMGARNVLVSMAGDGALLLAEDGMVYESGALEGTLVNGVGAGDSMVAGFLAGWLDSHSYEQAFQMGVAAGSASAFSEGLATRGKVEELLKQF